MSHLSEVRYIHPKLGAGRVTIAYREIGKTVQFSAAFSSPNEEFSKAKGRLIASGRLTNDRRAHVQVVISEGDLSKHEVHDMVLAAFNDHVLSGEDNVPRWAQKAMLEEKELDLWLESINEELEEEKTNE